jgi:hypothetical protein
MPVQVSAIWKFTSPVIPAPVLPISISAISASVIPASAMPVSAVLSVSVTWMHKKKKCLNQQCLYHSDYVCICCADFFKANISDCHIINILSILYWWCLYQSYLNLCICISVIISQASLLQCLADSNVCIMISDACINQPIWWPVTPTSVMPILHCISVKSLQSVQLPLAV